MGKILLIVDPQYDFINGTLAVKGAEDAMNKLTTYIETFKEGKYSKVFITADFHPKGHCSFETWPVHCIQHTIGSAIYEPLITALYDRDDDTPYEVLTKGTDVIKEEYSIFKNNLSKHILVSALEGKDVDVCGIAGDYCVKDTINDLLKLGVCKSITVLIDFVASIDGGKALNELIVENGLKTEHV